MGKLGCGGGKPCPRARNGDRRNRSGEIAAERNSAEENGLTGGDRKQGMPVEGETIRISYYLHKGESKARANTNGRGGSGGELLKHGIFGHKVFFECGVFSGKCMVPACGGGENLNAIVRRKEMSNFGRARGYGWGGTWEDTGDR